MKKGLLFGLIFLSTIVSSANSTISIPFSPVKLKLSSVDCSNITQLSPPNAWFDLNPIPSILPDPTTKVIWNDYIVSKFGSKLKHEIYPQLLQSYCYIKKLQNEISNSTNAGFAEFTSGYTGNTVGLLKQIVDQQNITSGDLKILTSGQMKNATLIATTSGIAHANEEKWLDFTSGYTGSLSGLLKTLDSKAPAHLSEVQAQELKKFIANMPTSKLTSGMLAQLTSGISSGEYSGLLHQIILNSGAVSHLTSGQTAQDNLIQAIQNQIGSNVTSGAFSQISSDVAATSGVAKNALSMAQATSGDWNAFTSGYTGSLSGLLKTLDSKAPAHFSEAQAQELKKFIANMPTSKLTSGMLAQLTSGVSSGEYSGLLHQIILNSGAVSHLTSGQTAQDNLIQAIQNQIGSNVTSGAFSQISSDVAATSGVAKNALSMAQATSGDWNAFTSGYTGSLSGLLKTLDSKAPAHFSEAQAQELKKFIANMPTSKLTSGMLAQLTSGVSSGEYSGLLHQIILNSGAVSHLTSGQTAQDNLIQAIQNQIGSNVTSGAFSQISSDVAATSGVAKNALSMAQATSGDWNAFTSGYTGSLSGLLKTLDSKAPAHLSEVQAQELKKFIANMPTSKLTSGMLAQLTSGVSSGAYLGLLSHINTHEVEIPADGTPEENGANLKTALETSPDNTTIRLSKGTYTINVGLHVWLKSGIRIVGAAENETIINLTNMHGGAYDQSHWAVPFLYTSDTAFKNLSMILRADITSGAPTVLHLFQNLTPQTSSGSKKILLQNVNITTSGSSSGWGSISQFVLVYHGHSKENILLNNIDLHTHFPSSINSHLIAIVSSSSGDLTTMKIAHSYIGSGINHLGLNSTHLNVRLLQNVFANVPCSQLAELTTNSANSAIGNISHFDGHAELCGSIISGSGAAELAKFTSGATNVPDGLLSRLTQGFSTIGNGTPSDYDGLFKHSWNVISHFNSLTSGYNTSDADLSVNSGGYKGLLHTLSGRVVTGHRMLVNDQAQLNAAIKKASVSSGSQYAIVLAPMTYNLDNVTIPQNLTIIGAGENNTYLYSNSGATFSSGVANRSIVKLDAGAALKDLTVYAGRNPYYKELLEEVADDVGLGILDNSSGSAQSTLLNHVRLNGNIPFGNEAADIVIVNKDAPLTIPIKNDTTVILHHFNDLNMVYDSGHWYKPYDRSKFLSLISISPQQHSANHLRLRMTYSMTHFNYLVDTVGDISDSLKPGSLVGFSQVSSGADSYENSGIEAFNNYHPQNSSYNGG